MVGGCGGFCLAGLMLPACAGEVGAEASQRFSMKQRGEAELSRRSSAGLWKKRKHVHAENRHPRPVSCPRGQEDADVLLFV